jgi:hypothetical protein
MPTAAGAVGIFAASIIAGEGVVFTATIGGPIKSEVVRGVAVTAAMEGAGVCLFAIICWRFWFAEGVVSFHSLIMKGMRPSR